MFKENKNQCMIYIMIYFAVNILNTWALFSPTFNGYLVLFELNITGFFNSFIGDMAILSIFLFIGLFIFKKRSSFLLYLLFVTLGLNIFIFVMFMFMRFYSTIFTFSLDIFNNPGDGLVGPLIFETLNVFFLKFRFLFLLPCFVLLLYYLYIKRFFEDIELKMALRTKIISLGNSILISILTLLITIGLISSKNESSLDVGLFSAKNGGFYSFYLFQLLGHRYTATEPTDLELEMLENFIELYDKNKDQYINALNEKKYSRNDNLTGVLEGHNLFVIQLESHNNFFLNQTINGIEVTPNLNKYINEQYYFSNVMQSVGLGNTSDAEFSVMTGLFPNGDTSVYWDYNEHLYDFAALPKLFNANNYETSSYHGNVGIFYNREIAHTQMLGFDTFYTKEHFAEMYPEEDYPHLYRNTWVSDEEVLNWGYKNSIDIINRGNQFFNFQVLLHPHTPYNSSSITQYDWGNNINRSQLAFYLDNIRHSDEILGSFLEEAMTSLPNTLFVLYGDHGSTIFDQELRDLLGINNNTELRHVLNQVPVFFLDNSNTIEKHITREEFAVVSKMAKSQRDIYRTIINLFDLYDESKEIFGVNMFSGEPSIVYESKNVDFKTDDFFTNFRNINTYILFNEKYDINRIRDVQTIIGRHRSMNNHYIRVSARIK